jgi:hypothetical protein
MTRAQENPGDALDHPAGRALKSVTRLKLVIA